MLYNSWKIDSGHDNDNYDYDYHFRYAWLICDDDDNDIESEHFYHKGKFAVHCKIHTLSDHSIEKMSNWIQIGSGDILKARMGDRKTSDRL